MVLGGKEGTRMVSIMEKNNEEDRWWLQDIIQKGERKSLREARRGDMEPQVPQESSDMLASTRLTEM